MSFLFGVSDESSLTSRWETYQDLQRTLHVAHVEYVSIVVFRSNGEVVGFHRIPGDAVRGEVEHSAV